MGAGTVPGRGPQNGRAVADAVLEGRSMPPATSCARTSSRRTGLRWGLLGRVDPERCTR